MLILWVASGPFRARAQTDHHRMDGTCSGDDGQQKGKKNARRIKPADEAQDEPCVIQDSTGVQFADHFGDTFFCSVLLMLDRTNGIADRPKA